MIEIEETKKRERQKNFSIKYIDMPVEFFIRHNVSPNVLSLIGFGCSLVAAFLIAIGWIYFSIWLAWFVPFLIGLGGAFDLFDGEVARRTNKESQSGAFLDSNLDRLSDAIFILSLIIGGLVTYLLGYILLFLVIMISYTRSRAENEGVNMKGVGRMERADRILFLLFTTLLEMWFYFLTFVFLGYHVTILVPFITRIPFLGYYLTILVPFITRIQVTPIFFIAIIIFTLALLYTVVQRIVFTFKTLRHMNSS